MPPIPDRVAERVENMKRNKTKGFTLIELLIVIAIIGILAAVLIPNLLTARKRAYDAAAQSCAKQIATAQEIYQIDNASYASALADLDTGTVKTCDTNTMTISFGSATSTTYEATVSHNQGSKTFTVTQDGIQ